MEPKNMHGMTKTKGEKKKLNGKVNNRPFLINKILPGNGFLI